MKYLEVNMSEDTTELKATLEAPKYVSAEEVMHLTMQLRQELLETDVRTVEVIKSGEAPAGSRAGEAVTIGALLMTLAASGGVLTTIISTVKDWLTRTDVRSISLEINGDKISITGASE